MNNGLPTSAPPKETATPEENTPSGKGALYDTLKAMGRLKVANAELERKLGLMAQVIVNHGREIKMLNDAFKIACTEQPGPLKDFFDNYNKEQRDATSTEDEHDVNGDDDEGSDTNDSDTEEPTSEDQAAEPDIFGSEDSIDAEGDAEREDDAEVQDNSEGAEDGPEETTETEPAG